MFDRKILSWASEWILNKDAMFGLLHMLYLINWHQLTFPVSVFLLTGLFLILGLMLYPAGWGSDKVQLYCGPDAAPYRAGLCSMGWAFYTAMGGTVLTFICAVFSAQAEIATSSDKVQEEIGEGKSLICLLWGPDTPVLMGKREEEEVAGEEEGRKTTPALLPLLTRLWNGGSALFTTKTDSFLSLFCVYVGEIYKCQVFFSMRVFVFVPLEVLCLLLYSCQSCGCPEGLVCHHMSCKYVCLYIFCT